MKWNLLLGDKSVYKYREELRFSSLQNYYNTKYYPLDGNGANITYVEIETRQVNARLF